MKYFTIIPFVLEFNLDFSRFTIGIGVVIDERHDKQIASALLHVGNDPAAGFSFDCCFLQMLQVYMNKG